MSASDLMGKRGRRRKRQLASDDEVVTVTFDIGTVFPSDDLVGQFVVSLAAAHNDLVHVNTAMFPPDDPGGSGVTPALRATLLRQVLARVWETHLLVQEASEHDVVDEFLSSLPSRYPGDKLDGAELLAMLRGHEGGTVSDQ